MITSRHNAQVKHVRLLLRSASQRQQSQQFVLESPKLIAELEQYSPGLLECVWRRGVDVSDGVFDTISNTKSSQGIIALARMPKWDLNIQMAQRVAILDGVQDPANVGAILRSAWAFGFDHILVHGDVADHYAPKALRSSAGAAWRIPVLSYSEDLVRQLSLSGMQFYVMDSNGGSGLNTIHDERVGIILGAEGLGPSSHLSAQCAALPLCIPMAEGVESLNVAVAAGIVFHGLFVHS